MQKQHIQLCMNYRLEKAENGNKVTNPGKIVFHAGLKRNGVLLPDNLLGYVNNLFGSLEYLVNTAFDIDGLRCVVVDVVQDKDKNDIILWFSNLDDLYPHILHQIHGSKDWQGQGYLFQTRRIRVLDLVDSVFKTAVQVQPPPELSVGTSIFVSLKFARVTKIKGM